MNSKHGGRLKGLVVLALCATAVVASGAWREPAPAQSPAPAATPTGVAIIKLKELFAGVAEFKEGMALIDQKKEESKKSLQAIEKQIKDLNDQFEMRKNPTMAERLEHSVRVVELEGQGNARAAALTRSLEVQAGDLMRRVFIKATAAAEKLCDKDGWDIILIDDRAVVPPERAPSEGGKEGRRITIGEVEGIIQQRTIMAAIDKRVDVTASLVEMMNNEYKAAKR